ncbi:MAG: PAS domain S-box protein [Oscillatoriales cyanobacterium RM2_1_1]|nr:PAS domain S-box protein [Oscillatoriales cyanobacterium SM2_3_0]NJO45738.1 PAS domain S-box protein [Oscillatoriales cyanobacterium RM2_1_1]
MIVDSANQAAAQEYLLESGFNLPIIYIDSPHPLNSTSSPVTQIDKFSLTLTQTTNLEVLRLAIELLLQRQELSRFQANEARFRKITETIDEIIWEVDQNLIFTYVSPKVKDILGYETTEILGQHCLSLLMPEQQDQLTTVINSFLEMKQPIANLEHIFAHKEGYYLLVETSGIPVFSEQDEWQGYQGVTRDITERQKVQESLLRSAATNRALINAIPDLILRINRGGKFVSYKPANRHSFQFFPEDFLNKNVDQVLPPALAEPTLTAVAAALKTGQLQTFEYQFRARDKLQFWESRIFISGDEEVMVLIRDISDRKLVEEELRNSLLEKDLLVREVHHRVKNNLQVISSIFSLQSQATDDPQLLNILEESQDRIRSMALIHEQLYQSNSLAKIDFKEYINSLTQNLLHSYSSFERVKFHLEIEPITLNLDTAIPCGLLINELVSNALKHGFFPDQAGEVKIKIHSLNGDGRQLCLRVQDNGVGLPENLDITQASSLGLRLVRALTRQLRGELEMYNQNGAIFKITFFRLD